MARVPLDLWALALRSKLGSYFRMGMWLRLGYAGGHLGGTLGLWPGKRGLRTNLEATDGV